jgi:hypothetical protein
MFDKGWEIEWVNNIWVYSDTKEPIQGWGGPERPCKKCGFVSPTGEPDRCLSVLPGVVNACCGHGSKESAYVEFSNGVILRGFEGSRKVDYASAMRCPQCGTVEEDFDGFGFIKCENCGYCTHPNATFEDGKWICGICGEEKVIGGIYEVSKKIMARIQVNRVVSFLEQFSSHLRMGYCS